MMSVDVEKWAAKDPWDMELTVEKPVKGGADTEIEVTDLHSTVAQGVPDELLHDSARPSRREAFCARRKNAANDRRPRQR
jgi:hypothetical protein